MIAQSREVTGWISDKQHWVRARLRFGVQIEHLAVLGGGGANPSSGFRNALPPDDGLPLVFPGFIDLHVHGGGGRDVMEGEGALETITAMHAAHGTTALLATTMTATADDIERALRSVRNHESLAARPMGAKVLGVHLEGPYISRKRLGAQPDETQYADLAQLQRWNQITPIRVVTMAPELEGAMAMISAMTSMGIRVQIGHSEADYDRTSEALAAGASGFTHLFNAMSGMNHRQPGVAAAALARGDYAEIIPDMLHVHPGVIHLARRALPNLYAVTDATSAAGMPDGQYRLGQQMVHLCRGAVRLDSGVLAGSALTMDQALRNLVRHGVSVHDAISMVSTIPANYLGRQDIGRLQPSCSADLVLMDRNFDVQKVYISGDPIVTRNVE